MRIVFSFTIIFLLISCQEKKEKTLFDEISKDGSKLFKSVLKKKDQYEVQILFSPIERFGDSISITDHFYNYRPGEYFYPASTVKMPVAFLALQKLNELRKIGIEVDKDTPIQIDSVRAPQSPEWVDSTNIGNKPTLGHYIDKVFAISDNNAYNRLYEFCGSDYINANLRRKGAFTNSRIVHRVGVSGFSFEENRFTPPLHFLNPDGSILYTNEASFAQGNHITIVDKTKKGVAYIDSKDAKIEEPFNFGQKNFININDLQESLKRIVFPKLYLKGEYYDLSNEDREFVMNSMAKLPKDHPYLKDKTEEFYDSYVKFFQFGDSKEPMPDHIIIRNKVGFAYGYLTDCAYIQDTKEGIEYFLTATVHVNENQTYNDGIYEYDDIGIPFLAELGRLVHDYMVQNKK